MRKKIRYLLMQMFKITHFWGIFLLFWGGIYPRKNIFWQTLPLCKFFLQYVQFSLDFKAHQQWGNTRKNVQNCAKLCKKFGTQNICMDLVDSLHILLHIWTRHEHFLLGYGKIMAVFSTMIHYSCMVGCKISMKKIIFLNFLW